MDSSLLGSQSKGSTSRKAGGYSRKKTVVLMPRDLEVLLEVYLHRAISSSQLASLCFSEISYETARKRLRRLQQAGFMGAGSSGRMEGRGRPELIYFLTVSGARALEHYKGVSWETIPTGPPHTYHKEHFLRLVDIRLALLASQKNGIIANLEFTTGREFWRELSGDSTSQEDQLADATISFHYLGHQGEFADSPMELKILLEIDTGNFRQTKHWEPKIRAFLKTGCPVWVVTGSEPRIQTLRKWTSPLLEEVGVGPGKCVFAIYNDIMQHGLFHPVWQRTDGSITDLRPRQ
jgi:hypothetical protein